MAWIWKVLLFQSLNLSPALTLADHDLAISPQNNHGGWVNPEDLAPMPQCIAQQDQSAWLNAMTKFICTHNQWLTQLSCLSAAFSPALIDKYFPYCDRSILAKVQLYSWIREFTGRRWLVNVGDATKLEVLSPASLAEGYAAVDTIRKAPNCLTDSVSARSMEPFEHVIASCSFTGTSEHTGNAARPWEYSESLRSMIALDTQTAGYNLVGHHISDGDYFDKDCFCSAFTIDSNQEPCQGSGQLDLTKELLWMNATCGSISLYDNWTDHLKTTPFGYIPMEDWHWPRCVADIPKQTHALADQCATDACEVDRHGYCRIKRAIDRACVCRDISYDTCGGSCHAFETRIDYTKWLHDLCGSVHDWHGLPAHWRQLAAPTPSDMVPWRWTMKPSTDSDETCASNRWKLGSFALVNIATFISALFIQRTGRRQITRVLPWSSHPEGWLSKGALFAVLQLLPNAVNALIVQNTHGYQHIPVVQLILLWCSVPRFAWIMILLTGPLPIGRTKYSVGASLLLAETVIQSLSSYYMVMTIDYGRNHGFYFGGIEGAERGGLAKTMYAGAAMWLIAIGITLVQSVRTTRKMSRWAECDSLSPPEWQPDRQITVSSVPELMGRPLDEGSRGLRDRLIHYWQDKSKDAENQPLTPRERKYLTVYGTLSVKPPQHGGLPKGIMELFANMTMMMVLLCIAQWLFWGGFIGLSSEGFCPPKLAVLTAVWVIFSVLGAIVIIA
ncbi:hypothetical protein BDV12DRAFT_190731 [Aspergillus spectabilis]